MTFPGCPAVFYGDEVGLSGGNDPDCRLAMEWDESLVVLNAGSEPVKTKIAAEGTWTPRISGRKPVSSESGGITVDLAPCSAEIYQKKAKGRK